MADARVVVTPDAPAIARVVAVVARRAVIGELAAWRARIAAHLGDVGVDADALLCQLDARLAEVRAGSQLLVRTGAPVDEDVDWRRVAVQLARRPGADWIGLSTPEADALRTAVADAEEIDRDAVAERTADAADSGADAE